MKAILKNSVAVFFLEDTDKVKFSNNHLVINGKNYAYGFDEIDTLVIDSVSVKYPIGGAYLYNNGTFELVESVVIDMVKADKKAEIKKAFVSAYEKPIVDTGLGFSVDGAYNNKTDFETGKKYGFPQVRASDNTMHDVTASDYDTIIQAIEMNGVALYQYKWELEAQLEQATTILEVEEIKW